jgi:uncharacterized protein with ATP-grasp and redox domains
MKTYVDCLPCFLSQALKAARMATADENIHREVLDQVMKSLVRLPLEAPPPQIAQSVYGIITELTGNGDPYAAVKKNQNEVALGLYPELKEMVRNSEDPLLLALKLAIAGNIIDLAVPREIQDIREEVFSIIASPPVVNDYPAFSNNLHTADLVLYLGDNAGEIVFDRILIEELNRVNTARTVFVVREKPIINDAVLDDAKFVGLDKEVEIISNGSDAPATVLTECSAEFTDLFQKADMIVAKGQGNYESLSDEEENIFFLLTVKCPVVARHLHAKVGDMILKGNRYS